MGHVHRRPHPHPHPHPRPPHPAHPPRGRRIRFGPATSGEPQRGPSHRAAPSAVAWRRGATGGPAPCAPGALPVPPALSRLSPRALPASSTMRSRPSGHRAAEARPGPGPCPSHPCCPYILTRQMCPDSEVITELRRPAPDCRTRFIAFRNDVDQLMIRAETVRMDHPDVISRNTHVNRIGHLALAVHFSVARRDPRGPGRRRTCRRRATTALRPGTSDPFPAASAGPELPNVNRTSGQGTAYSQPKDGQMPFPEMLKSHRRLSVPRTAGYSRR